MGILYMLAGLNHFIMPSFYMAIMPSYIPWHSTMVIVSGLIEIALGALMFSEKYRSFAAWGIILLLIAVFPANIQQFTTQETPFLLIHPGLWIRATLQLLLIIWAYRYTKEMAQRDI